MLYQIVNDFPNTIIYEEEGPFISLYQPTHRHGPENQQDVIRFKNLIREIEGSLKQNYPNEDIEMFMKPFNALSDDKSFWDHAADGLAILASKNTCVIYKLPRNVEELSVVGERFHIKPLIRTFQSSDRYHLLGLDRKNFILYEGDRYGFEEVEIDPEVPRTAEEVLGDEYTDSYLGYGSHGGAGNTPLYHGHGGRKDALEIDTQRYFRYVDKFITENYSNTMKLPLILMTLDEYHGEFRKITNNAHLLDKGIRKDYKEQSMDQIKQSAWALIEPIYLEKTKALVERFYKKQSEFVASDDLSDLARAVREKRVETLILEADKVVIGCFDKETGKLERKENTESCNVLDELADMMIKNKGEVVILPKERMPSTTGAAAIYRY
ncbi:MAG: hypothetical protein GX078_02185 [Clostridiales bacterium]|nr:hypothetical protein [Clostridiales bacterium]